MDISPSGAAAVDASVALVDPDLRRVMSTFRRPRKSQRLSQPVTKRRKLSLEPPMLPAILHRLLQLLGGSPSDNVASLEHLFL